MAGGGSGGGGVTTAAQALQNLQGSNPGAAGGFSFTPPAAAMKAFQAATQGPGDVGSFQAFAGAPATGGMPGFQQTGAQAFQKSVANLANPSASSMPLWQKGLMGVVTGSPQYGQNAPAAHALMQAGMGLAKPPTNAAPAAAMPPRPMPMQGTAAPPGIPASTAPMIPSAPPGLGMAPAGGMAPMQPQMPGQMPMQGQQPMTGGPQINPQMLQQLRAQYPQLFGGM